MLHTSAVHNRSLEVEIKPYTFNNDRWVSNYVTATYFRQYLI